MHSSPKTSTHHLYLIHDEDNTANLTPALDPNFQPKEVTLVYDQPRAPYAQALTSILSSAGLEIHHLQLLNDYDVNHIRERILERVIQREDDEWALNIAGGSRPMCAVAHEIFRDLELPIFFADSDHDYIYWIFHPELPELPPPAPLANRVKLKAFFKSYLGQITSLEPLADLTLDHIKLCKELAQRAYLYRDQLKTLNYLAASAENSLRSNPLDRRHRSNDQLMWLIQRFERAGLLQLSESRAGDQLTFPDEDSRFFVNGGWLERYVQHSILSLKKKRTSLQDLGRSVEILWRREGEEIKNEIDVAFLANNRLFIIECKTKTFRDHGSASEVLYKLDTLQNMLGGVKCYAMFVSYHPISRAHERRASALSLEVCAGDDLARLEDILLQWIPKSNELT